MKRYPKLYKMTDIDRLQEWSIEVKDNIIYSKSSKFGGKEIHSKDIIKSGKNIGRSNETTPSEQAILEATSRFNKKKKAGYVENIEGAIRGEVSELVEGGYLPTLAHSFEKREKDIIYPCAAQPKLDGVRSTFTGENNMWSRSRKKQIGIPHIPKELIAINQTICDGELYNHDYKDDFETIIHFTNQKKKPIDGHEVVQYHVYDIPSEKPFHQRMVDLVSLGKKLSKDSSIKIVETVICKNKQELLDYREHCLDRGYEGAMVRNLDAPYENKRSKHLQKLKIMEDDEFKVIGCENGRGKLQNLIGAFVCLTPEGNEFRVKCKGKLSSFKLEDGPKYINQILTVQFQGYTNKNNVPRFPVGLRFRSEE